LASIEQTDAGKVARRIWPQDEPTAWLTRAASSPETLSSASPLVALVVADLIAASTVAGIISVPTFTAAASYAGFVSESNAIPVMQGLDTATTLVPKKLASFLVLSRELANSSNAEAMLRDLLTRSVGLALDTVIFDANPADSTRPPGLLDGLSPLAASTAPTSFDAMIEDMSTLAAAVASVGTPIAFIGSPDRILRLKLQLHYQATDFADFILLPSYAVPSDVLICVATKGLVSALEPVPQIRLSSESGLHMDDAPLPIVDGSGTLAVPVRSLRQTASIGLRLRFGADWALRSPQAVAYVDGNSGRGWWRTASGQCSGQWTAEWHAANY
jgi:hypothetical protein